MIFAPQPTNGAKNLRFIHSIGAGTDQPQAKNWRGATSASPDPGLRRMRAGNAGSYRRDGSRPL